MLKMSLQSLLRIAAICAIYSLNSIALAQTPVATVKSSEQGVNNIATSYFNPGDTLVAGAELELVNPFPNRIAVYSQWFWYDGNSNILDTGSGVGMQLKPGAPPAEFDISDSLIATNLPVGPPTITAVLWITVKDANGQVLVRIPAVILTFEGGC